MEQMKKSWIIVSIFEILIYMLLSLLIFNRSIDGSGAVQTPELKMITWYILNVPFAFLLIAQIIWFVIIKKHNN
ncbi:DUF3923 family protein [Lactiplantibacillus plantarum]|uniref:DUF3923 family protein n=1 Tax=Lactiplantibacillus plantarum TaxID=1590 RepID=UPI0034668365